MDRFDQYAGEPTMAEYYGDACSIPIRDSALDYVATSHVLEHVADPVRAILEWFRVIRNGGHIYMVVPHRALTFDHRRALTEVEHMLHDHRMGTTQVDGTHIDDFVFNLDWSRFSPGTPVEQVPTEQVKLANTYRSMIQAGQEINIHFHTFEPERTAELMRRINELLPTGSALRVVEQVSPFPASRPDGFLLIAQVTKPVPLGARRNAVADRASVLLPEARPMVRG